MKTKLLSLAFIAAAAPGMAQAAIISGYGVYAETGTASNCPSFCTTANGGDFQNDSDGGEFATVATSTENSYGKAWSMAQYTGSTTTYLPVLKVDTSSDLGRRAGADAFGVQGYSFSGADGTSITLNIDLTGDIGDNPTGYVSNTLKASIAVIKTSALDWLPEFGTLVFEVAPQGSSQGEEFLFLSSPGLNLSTTGSLTFTVDDGDDFYVVAELQANAQNGFASSTNTLNMSFDNDTGLTAVEQTTVIPVPAAVWLFASGLIGLIGIARRR